MTVIICQAGLHLDFLQIQMQSTYIRYYMHRESRLRRSSQLLIIIVYLVIDELQKFSAINNRVHTRPCIVFAEDNVSCPHRTTCRSHTRQRVFGKHGNASFPNRKISRFQIRQNVEEDISSPFAVGKSFMIPGNAEWLAWKAGYV